MKTAKKDGFSGYRSAKKPKEKSRAKNREKESGDFNEADGGKAADFGQKGEKFRLFKKAAVW